MQSSRSRPSTRCRSIRNANLIGQLISFKVLVHVARMDGVTIRKTQKSDCDLLLQLIKESADEDDSAVNLEINSKDLEDNGFGPSPSFHSLVAEVKKGVLVGYVLFYYTYSTWEGRCVCIEDIYVTRSSRRQGIALALWKNVVQIAHDNRCVRCNIAVKKGDARAVAFLQRHGTVNLTEKEGWLFFRMNKNAIDGFLKKEKNVEGYCVRKAKKSDCGPIRQLIQDLADYGKMPEWPQIGPDVLAEDGFGDVLFYDAFVVENGGILVGYTLFFYTYSWQGPGVYMEDLYVSSSHRGRGLGMALWQKVIQAGLNVGGNRCDFSVLDWNTPSIEFYKKMGAVDMTELDGMQFFRMTKGTMENFVNS